MIETPYKTAFFFPSAFVLLCFVKKLTVIGIIGKTHGIIKAIKPLKNAPIKTNHNDCDFFGLGTKFLNLKSKLYIC